MFGRRISIAICLVVLAVWTAAGDARSAAAQPVRLVSLEVTPPDVALVHDDQSVQLLVTGLHSDGSRKDYTSTAKYASANPDIAIATAGRILAAGDGSATIRIGATGPAGNAVKASVQVSVTDFAAARPLNFINDVLPVLTKQGCNAGNCHGKAIGQNGFKLSLYGFDPQSDHIALVHQSRGRRIAPAAPAESLMLLKASGGIAHGGGMRFAVDSEPYRLLLRWIEQHAPWGQEDDTHIVRMEVEPSVRVLANGDLQQLRVTAHYADGARRDVTPLARYDSQHPLIVEVSEQGLVKTLKRRGEGDVMVRYAGLVATARLSIPYSTSLGDEAYAGFEPQNFIDELVLAKWRTLGIAPSNKASDAEFIRRAFLDATGTLPSPDEVRAYLDDTQPKKRKRLVDSLLKREEFADLWSHKWGDLLRNKAVAANFKEHSASFAKWIRTSIAEDKPYDQFVRDILTVSGNRKDHPQMDWWRQAINHQVRVEDTSQVFLGLRVSCANCHNHPFESISQNDYWQFAAFFARVGAKSYGAIETIKLEEKGKVKHPRTGEEMLPKGFGGQTLEYQDGVDPRVTLVDWMTAAENPYFARAIANRIWGHYMKIGLVEPVDDMRATNPPSNPDLLDALAKELVDHKYQLTHLMRLIMTSEVYALSSTPLETNAADARNYARCYPRRLAPHVLMDAVAGATGVPDKFDGYDDARRAVQLPNEMARSDFLDVFGRSRRDTPCECETSHDPNLAQVLYLLHSDRLQRKLSDKSGVVAKLVADKKPVAAAVDELFLRAFSRPPTDAERSDAVALVEAVEERQLALEDLLWTLLNSKEFLFNH